MRLLFGNFTEGSIQQSLFQKCGHVAPPVSHHVDINGMGSLIDLIDYSVRLSLNFPVRKDTDSLHFRWDTPTIRKFAQTIPRLDKFFKNCFGHIRPFSLTNKGDYSQNILIRQARGNHFPNLINPAPCASPQSSGGHRQIPRQNREPCQLPHQRNCQPAYAAWQDFPASGRILVHSLLRPLLHHFA